MKKYFFELSVFLIALTFSQFALAYPNITLNDLKKTKSEITVDVSTNLKQAVYKRDESILFNISVSKDKTPLSGFINYTLSIDGAKVLQEGTIKLDRGLAQVYWKSSNPSIIQCRVEYSESESGEKKIGIAAAAVDPFHIVPTTSMPDDFVSYWNNQKMKLSSIPVNAELNKSKVHQTKVSEITLDNINGTKVHGYFGKPDGDSTYPAILYIPGAGVNDPDFKWVEMMVSKGFMALAISVHDLPVGQNSQYYSDKSQSELKDYLLQDRESRDSFYFHRVILGCLRAIDYLANNKNWDKRHLIVYGSSQGGGLTLITSGLDSRVTAAIANVPAMCDHSGGKYGRPTGSPSLIPKEGSKDLKNKILEVSGYYDAVNFAHFIRVPVVFGVGLIDNACPPTTVFSAYNTIKSKKQIDIAPLMGHDFNPGFIEMQEAFTLAQGRN